MNRLIIFDSDSQPNQIQPDRCARLLVHVSITNSVPDECDVELEYISNETASGVRVEFADLPLGEQRAIQRLIADIETDPDVRAFAEQEYAEGLADLEERSRREDE